MGDAASLYRVNPVKLDSVTYHADLVRIPNAGAQEYPEYENTYFPNDYHDFSVLVRAPFGSHDGIRTRELQAIVR